MLDSTKHLSPQPAVRRCRPLNPVPRLFWCAIVYCLCSFNSSAQSTVFVTRHADRQGFEPDPPLTATGECQARELARLLCDANIKHIFTTDALRTRQTAVPTAMLSGVLPVIVPQEDFEDLISRIRATLGPGEATLVVGHRGTVPRIVKELTGVDIEPLGSGEYSRLIVLTLFPDGRSHVFTLRQSWNVE